ncbi:unnamed protein product [Closterium sp. Yama58-4]|nr:unnamed protein product [Closterium sp. Yama58-4]
MLSALGASSKTVLRADVQPCAPCHAHRFDSAHHLPAIALLSHSAAPQAHQLRALRSSAAPFPPGSRADRGRRSAVVRASAEAETPQSERLQLNGSVLRADPLWSAVTEQVAIGGSVTTASAEDVRALQTQFGMTAVVNVEEESAMKARGSSWDEERRRLEEQGVVAVWVPVKEHDATEQALMLPQVVRVVAALVAAGHTVLLQCSAGDRISPLIAIGYLMFVRAMPADAASALVAERRAGISPPMGVLTEAMEKVLAGATARVIEIAESNYRQRVRTGQPGDSNSDWVQAQRAYINEAFAKWLAADVSFAESIAQAAERKAREQQAAEEAERRAAGPAKRLLTPIRWSDSAKAPAPAHSAPPAAAGAGGSSEALAAANRRVAALSKELEGVTRVADEQAATLQRAGQQVAELTGQVEALQRKERLYTEALAQANERMELLGERMRAVEQEGRAEKERLEGEVRTLRARVEADEQRGSRAATVIQGLRMELQAAKDEVKEQWAAVTRAEKSIEALTTRVKEEEQRAQRAEAAALAAEEDKRRALKELEGAKGESVSESAEARERMAALSAQVAQLSERLKAATGVAEKATGRADVLEKQVAQLEARARKAEEQEAVSARAAALLTEQVKTLEGSAAEAGARVGQLSGELERLRMREAERAAEGVASGERAKQLMALVKELSEKEARQRARTEQMEAKLAELRNQDSELASRAAVFSAQMEEMARQLARLNAELAFAEGREGEVQEAWRAQLGAASDVMGAMGAEAAALAAERGVEMEMEQAEGQPGELLRVLMQRVSSEAAAVRERSARLIEETHHMRHQLDQARTQVQEGGAAQNDESAAARLKEYVEAAEAMAVEQKQKLVDRVHSLQWLLGATIALAVIIPATAFYSFFTDDSHATQVEMLRSRLAAATSGRQELESAAVKAEASKRAALSAVQTLEKVVEAQRGSVERLQALIPLVAPSIQSEQAARFCANVPVEYQSAVTQRFCSDIVPPSDSAPPATAPDT